MSTSLSAAVHTGVFHGDEVSAIAALSLFTNVATTRTLSPKIQDYDLILDVGGEFDGIYNFDHHQEGTPSRDNGIPFSSFGLIMMRSEWGMKVVEQFGVQGEMAEIVLGRLDEKLIQGVDAQDNGCLESANPEPASLSYIISSFNPTWIEQETENREQEAAFQEAVDYARQIIRRILKHLVAEVKAETRVVNAGTEGSASVLVLPQYVPWDAHLPKRADYHNLLYVVHPSARGGWQIWQVPEEPGSFTGRKPFPEDWADVRGKDLEQRTGMDLGGDDPSVFIHKFLFTGGATTREAAVDLACLAASK